MNENVAKAVSHPVRMRLLMLLNRRVSSPSELAEEIGEPLNAVAYHVKRLLELDCIELVRTEARRGAVEHYYRSLERPILSEDDLAKLPIAVRRGLADSILTQIAQDLRAAGTAGFDREGAHATNTQLVLDQEGWSELGEAMETALHRLIEIQAETTNRVAAGSDDGEEKTDTFLANVSLMLFEKPSAA